MIQHVLAAHDYAYHYSWRIHGQHPHLRFQSFASMVAAVQAIAALQPFYR